jgi:4-amino-4-deoxychorismate lyase
LAQKDDCDEILITRNGLITDTSYSNVVFGQGEQYFTPESTLLNGTKRQKLLQEGKITEKRIDRNSLIEYDRIYLINAMLDITDGVSLPIDRIIA